MWRVIRLAVIGLTILLVIPFVAFGLYDISVYQSRSGDIKRVLSSATPDERKPSESLKHLFRISLRDHTTAYTAKLLIRELQVPTNSKLEWHSINALWWGLVELHLDEDEQVTILASRSYMGNHRYGLSTESLARFGKPLAKLNQEEKATLVALTHARPYI